MMTGDARTKPNVIAVAEELFASLFNDEAEDGRLNGLAIEGGLRMREVQLVRAYISYWRQTGSKFSVRYMAETLRGQPMMVKELVDAGKARATFMTISSEVLKVVTDVAAADVAVPAGFKENK